jgi:hypothetical protein
LFQQAPLDGGRSFSFSGLRLVSRTPSPVPLRLAVCLPLHRVVTVGENGCLSIWAIDNFETFRLLHTLDLGGLGTGSIVVSVCGCVCGWV